MARQVPISFKDLAVRFSEEEWRLLEEGQREFYRDVMRENYETLVSVGTAELLPLSAFLSPTEPRGVARAGSCPEETKEAQEAPAAGGPRGGQSQHSLHLTALVQLVKEIPEYLFGEIKGTEDSPESGGAGLDRDRASPEAAVAVGTYPLQGLLSCLPDSPASQPSLATTPTSSSSSSGPPGDGGWGSPFPIKTVDRLWPTEKEGSGAPSVELNMPTDSPSQRKSHRRQERGPLGTGVSPGTSPLQSLVNCLREILVPGPQHPGAAPGSVPPPLSPVKTEAASEECPLQGLLNCLKEIPDTQDGYASPPRAGPPWLQEDPGPWKRNSGGSGCLPTPPHAPGPGAGRALAVVKVEKSWAQSPPVPASCERGRRDHSPSAARDARGVHVPGWAPEAPACRAAQSPLKALEACLKGIPTSALSPSQPPAGSWSRSLHPGDAGSRRPEPRPQGSRSEDGAKEPLAPLGPPQPPAPRGTSRLPSAGGTDGVLDRGSPGGSCGRYPGRGCPPGSSPLQGLESCLREARVPRLQSAQPRSSAADGGPRRAESRSWVAYREGLRGEACEPAQPGGGGGEAPAQSPSLARPQAVPSSHVPACRQQGLKDQGTSEPGPWRWPQDGAIARPSPLHCLESSLRGILPAGPLRFACLTSPSPGPGPSSSSSLCSSDGEDQRPEAKLWPPPLQERGHLPSHKRPVPLSPGSRGSPTGSSDSSPGEDPGRTEPQDCRGLRAEKAEEETGNGSVSLRREEGTEGTRQPGLLSNATAGGQREAAGHPWPAPLPEKRPRPSARENLRDLQPRVGRPSVAARFQGRPLPGDPPERPSESLLPAAASPACLAAPSQPPCSCGRPLRQELHNLGAALTEKLDQLAVALAGLAQEVAAMRTQVERLRRHPRGSGSKGPGSWLWSLPRGSRWAHSPGHRHLPYWRQKGPARPRPKILRAQAEGCRAGDPQGLTRTRAALVPQRSADAVSEEPSRPSRSPSQQPASGPSYPAVLAAHTFLGHPGHPQGRLSPVPPAAFPPLQASPAAATDPEPLAVGGLRVSIPARPREPRGALQKDLWGSEHRDPRWGAR